MKNPMNWGKKNSNLKAILVKTETKLSKISIVILPISDWYRLSKADIHAVTLERKTLDVECFLIKREGLLLRAKDV